MHRLTSVVKDTLEGITTSWGFSTKVQRLKIGMHS